MEAAILQYAEAAEKKNGDPTKKHRPGVIGWIKDWATGFILAGVLLTIACFVQYFE